MIKKNNVEKERNRYKTKTTGAGLGASAAKYLCLNIRSSYRLRHTTNATGDNECSWKWWRHKNMFGNKMICFSHIPNLLGFFFSCIAAGKRYYLLQIQMQRHLFMTNENKNTFFFSQARFHQPQHTSVNIFWPLHIFCANAFVFCFCVVVTLEPPLMHFFESQVVSMSTESGNGSKLDFC